MCQIKNMSSSKDFYIFLCDLWKVNILQASSKKEKN